MDASQQTDAPPKVRIFRDWIEHCRPGGWWRRDLVLQILEETYPAWVCSRQVADVACVINPRWSWTKRSEIHASKALSRLHGLGLVDRIGQRGGLSGRRPGNDWRHGWLSRPGYRYRIVRRKESLL